eukprot:gi/632967273/ref/XP_007899887.1/ PREDICTED: uncharacterized protein LOC103183930 isoform X4 [Callorhinchus milii]
MQGVASGAKVIRGAVVCQRSAHHECSYSSHRGLLLRFVCRHLREIQHRQMCHHWRRDQLSEQAHGKDVDANNAYWHGMEKSQLCPQNQYCSIRRSLRCKSHPRLDQCFILVEERHQRGKSDVPT